MNEWDFNCKLLGVQPNASLDDIKRAYRENAKLLHPDRHENNPLAKEKFQQINEAYTYLSENWNSRFSSNTEKKDSQDSDKKPRSDYQSPNKDRPSSSDKENVIPPNVTMEQFIHLLVKEIHKPSVGKSVLATIGMLALGNLISLPFGRVYVGYSRDKTHLEVEKEFMQALTSPFSTGFFTGEFEKRCKGLLKKEYFEVLDSLPNEYKLKILSLALKNQNQYKEFVNQEKWRFQKASGE